MFSLLDYMDYEGQKKVETISVAMLASTAVVGLVVGFLRQSVLGLSIINAVGLLLTFLVTLPSWPTFRSHPVKWLPRIESKAESTAPAPTTDWLSRITKILF
ncbi:microsomal signal peptidase 12 kDa subunit-domain-containing protein [Polychytrium aggregatum]|uniref:microsomal signal peptidase 12 kDa subunit-domain-containing protein n=1 Tax=Polychytrium aggregatum TaxID=110093 RepID=UPI0022FEA975|nr:microsomal signal peptidase 12 kDa subunit-domain-containing protein [Polychytrium aggregatum]KAI9193372.1 microsomal signal peptidase 12 kDa subunit-domain-containing protein [Polychytrium aggregatum]